jgi:EAL domain-containing protein (putative c-di-GMP-specific phosphodiesterase class I)
VRLPRGRGFGRKPEHDDAREGVETKEQLDKLREKGCTEVQGYYFSRPKPASKALAMIEGVQAKI